MAIDMANSMKYPFLDLGMVNAPYMDELEEAATRVVRSGRYIGGAEVESLENELAQMFSEESGKLPYVIGVSNGLDALRLIFRAYIELGRLHKGDQVIVPANTFIATLLAVTDNDLVPVTVEVDEHTYNLSAETVEAALTDKVKAIVPVHLYGRAAWSKELLELSRKYNLIVVEDNAQAIGAKAENEGKHGLRRTGVLGDASAISFYPTKNVGALGDGGAVVTFDKDLAETVRSLANYGSKGRYCNVYQGLNCRLDSIQAAFLRVKLAHIDDENDYRRSLAKIYANGIINTLIINQQPDRVEKDVWHQYVIRVKDGRRKEFMDYMAKNSVGTDIHYATPVHKQPCYQQELGGYSLPVAEKICDQIVSLPITRTTSEEDARQIVKIINAFK